MNKKRLARDEHHHMIDWMKRLLAAAAIILTATSSYAADIKSTPLRDAPANTAVNIKGKIDEYDYDRFLTAVKGIPQARPWSSSIAPAATCGQA